jgi:hypothetical protein
MVGNLYVRGVVRLQAQFVDVVLRPRLVVGLRIQRVFDMRLVVRLVVRLALVVVVNCLLKNERQNVMHAFWLVQLRVIWAGVQQPLKMHQSMKHCHMLVWQVFLVVVLALMVKFGQYTQVPLNLQQRHTPHLHSEFQMVLTGLPVRLEMVLTTVVQGMPLLQPVMNALANGDLNLGDMQRSPGTWLPPKEKTESRDQRSEIRPPLGWTLVSIRAANESEFPWRQSPE